MSTVTGTITGQPGPVIDTSHVDGASFHAGSQHTSPASFSTPNTPTNRYRNTGNVTQLLTLNATNLSANINSVTIDLGRGSNAREIGPGEYFVPSFVVDLAVPATPTEVDAPAVSEPWSFDVEATWAVV